MKILMVCLGNICRSPLAEGVLRSKLFLSDVTVDSAGTGAYHIGNPPDKRSIKVAKEHGIDITGLRGRQFSTVDFDNFDIIFVMDQQNYNNVIKLARNQSDIDKVSLILDEVFPGENLEVPDPYTGGQSGFTMVYDMLNKACDVIVEKIKDGNYEG